MGIAVKGRVTKKDCNDVLMPAMKKSLKRHDKIRLYYELNSRFPGAAWDDLNVGIDTGVRDRSGVQGSRLDHCDSRISCECRGFCAGPKTLASIPTTPIAVANVVVERMAWDGLK